MTMTLNSTKRWYEFRAAAGETELQIYEDIGHEGITADAFVRDLKAITSRLINVRISSNGGFVTDSTTIYNALKAHPARIIVWIDGLAASGASIIAMAGDEIRIASNAFIMIHEATGVTLGEAHDHMKTAEILEKMNDAMANIYASRTGRGSASMWRAAMAEESWYTATEAKAAGLADVVVDASGGVRAAASFNLSNCRNVPAALADGNAKARERFLSYARNHRLTLILQKELVDPRHKSLVMVPGGAAIVAKELFGATA